LGNKSEAGAAKKFAGSPALKDSIVKMKVLWTIIEKEKLESFRL